MSVYNLIEQLKHFDLDHIINQILGTDRKHFFFLLMSHTAVERIPINVVLIGVAKDLSIFSE